MYNEFYRHYGIIKGLFTFCRETNEDAHASDWRIYAEIIKSLQYNLEQGYIVNNDLYDEYYKYYKECFETSKGLIEDLYNRRK
jgi:hypothetical protein